MKSIKYLVVLVTLYVMANPAILLLPSITAVQAGNYSHNHNTQAKTCYVDAIKYRNKGAYNVQDLGFHWVQSTPDHNEPCGLIVLSSSNHCLMTTRAPGIELNTQRFRQVVLKIELKLSPSAFGHGLPGPMSCMSLWFSCSHFLTA